MTASADLEFSLCVVFFFLTLCCVYLRCHNLPGFSALSLQLRKFARLCFSFSFLCVTWKVFQGSKVGLSKVSPNYFSLLRDYCPLLLDVQCPYNHFFKNVVYSFLVVSGRKEIWSLLLCFGWNQIIIFNQTLLRV